MKIIKLMKSHKVLFSLAAAVFAVVAYLQVSGDEQTPPRYILAAATRGTITSTISGSGQVSVSQQVDVKAKVSGDVTAVYAQQGQEVKTGTALAQLDSREAVRGMRDAQLNLQSAQLAFEKLKQPADELSLLQARNALASARRQLASLREPPDETAILQAQNALTSARESKTNAEKNLAKSYDDGYNAVANAFLDLPTIMAGLQDMFFDDTISNAHLNIDWYVNQVVYEDQNKTLGYKKDFNDDYNAARIAYNENFDDYRDSSRKSDAETLEALIVQSYETTKLIADAVKSANNFIDFVQDSLERRNATVAPVIASHQTTLDSYTGESNGHLTALLNAKDGIQNDKEAIGNAERSLMEKEAALEDLKNGADDDDVAAAEETVREREASLKKLEAGADGLDLKSQELTLAQRENSLADAREKLADYSVRAPFDGVIAKALVKKGDSVSSSAVVTLIAKERIAEISLNEVDVSHIKLEQKAILTFDAVQDLSLTGVVAEIDTIGTNSQGVVSYNIKIIFDTQDERIKPGMSVSANIITAAKIDALMVPSSAVKMQGESSYVQTPDESEIEDADGQTSGGQIAGAGPTGLTGVLLSAPPVSKPVAIGISNDEFIEILEGLAQDELVVSGTINAAATAASSQSSGAIRLPGLGGGGGGNFRTR